MSSSQKIRNKAVLIHPNQPPHIKEIMDEIEAATAISSEKTIECLVKLINTFHQDLDKGQNIHQVILLAGPISMVYYGSLKDLDMSDQTQMTDFHSGTLHFDEVMRSLADQPLKIGAIIIDVPNVIPLSPEDDFPIQQIASVSVEVWDTQKYQRHAYVVGDPGDQNKKALDLDPNGYFEVGLQKNLKQFLERVITSEHLGV